MDVVNAVNDSNLILPAGDVKIGPTDYYVYSNSMVTDMSELNSLPIKTVGKSWVTVWDVGKAEDANQTPIQHRARERPALRLHCDHEAGRGYQHH